MLQYQATQRNGEAWKASLRYRQPNFDQMLGLRRLTLCENNLGDNGARIFADAIKDDLWVKGKNRDFWVVRFVFDTHHDFLREEKQPPDLRLM